MLVRRTTPVAFECVVRGYLSGSAWAEYRRTGRWPARRSRPGFGRASGWSPALLARHEGRERARRKHDRRADGRGRSARELATRAPRLSFAVYRAGRDDAAARGIIIADTKFEFGRDADGTLLLIDEVLTPDSAPASGRPTATQPGRSQPSFDKQPLRDYLAGSRRAGQWNGEAPPPPLPAEVVDGDERALPRGVPAA